MIERLHIEALALVESLTLEFGPGLNVLTGETGAGKSIVLGALGLLAGARADAGALREGADEAVVEALFDTRALPALAEALRARGLDDGGEEGLIVRRTLSRSGRGRAFIGGRMVPVATLAELFAERIEISSQHASLALLKPEAQARLLDGFGDLLSLRAQVAKGVAGLRENLAEIARLAAASEERARREDYLKFQVNEIDAAELDAEAFRALEGEHARLANAERLGAGVGEALAALSGEGATEERACAADLASRAARTLDALAQLDPALAPLSERAHAAQGELAELAADAERYLQTVEASPARLAAVEERIAQVEALRRKYGAGASAEGVTGLDAILETRARAAAELAELSGSDERLHKLQAEQEAARAALLSRAQKLSRGRAKAARALEEKATRAIRTLALEDARFAVELAEERAPEGLPCGAGGLESVNFLFSANAGEKVQALRRVASGGERSRIFLALKNVLRRTEVGMVLLFDEVDAGIGGAVAERVGAVLGALAKDHQVLCITHLPQIASDARARHFRVFKESARGRTTTRVMALDDEARVDEIARMAGGEKITEATRRHARALLAPARGARKS